jgi:SAM-dependent methyltransferase
MAEHQSYDRSAELYDLAFSWPVDDEVSWLCERFGASARRLLEPACGSGRMFSAFAARGRSLAGLDSSATMLSRARARMAAAGLPEPRLWRSDMASFELGVTFDGALCPINSFGYLLSEEAAGAHLAAMARHLRPGARYLIQLGLADMTPGAWRPSDPGPTWSAEASERRLDASWSAVAFDPERGIETQRCRLVAGHADGTVERLEELHEQRLWSFGEWRALIAESPFRQVAAYDGDEPGYRALPVDRGLEGRSLCWHELQL